MKKEIEKKYLLKSLPISSTGFSEIQHIIQYYYLVGDIWYRIRKIDSSLSDKPIYLHTIKTYKEGICYEEERNYSHDEYVKLIKKINTEEQEVKFITKTRYIYNTGIFADFEGDIKELKWEIDVFDFKLVIAEIEIPDFGYKIDIPKFIQNYLICDVTEIKEFSNRNLANKIP